MDIYGRTRFSPNHGNGVTVRPLPIYPDSYDPRMRGTRLQHGLEEYGPSRNYLLHRSFHGISPHDQPIFNLNTPKDDNPFTFHNLWNSGQQADLASVSHGDVRSQATMNPIIDFPDTNAEYLINVEEEELIEPVNFIANNSRNTSTANYEDIQEDRQERVEQTGSTSNLQLVVRAPRIPNDDYVSLETIRKVKNQARQQAIRMRESRHKEQIEMIDLSNCDKSGIGRREQNIPGRNRSNSNSSTVYRECVHNPITAERSNGPTPRRSDSGRTWQPGNRGKIPDGIIAGIDTNIYPQRLIAIPESTYSATIYASSEKSDNIDVTDASESSKARIVHDTNPNSRRQVGNDIGRTRHTPTPVPVLIPGNRGPIDARKGKQLLCVFVIFVCILVLVVLIGLILTFLFSPTFQGCRGNIECTRRAIVITGVVIAGGVILCLCGTCCLWCVYVSHSHILSRRRAYPIHHHPSTGMGMG